MSLTNYLSNIQEAYSPFSNRFFDTYESCKAVLSKPDEHTNLSSSSVKAEPNYNDEDLTRVESYALKALATPFLMTSLYIMGKVAYTRHFSYKGLLFAGAMFTIGHDLANGAEKLASSGLSEKTITPIEENGYSEFLSKMLRYATKLIPENEHSAERREHVYGFINSQLTTALSDAISNDIFLSAREMFNTKGD
jgi:hypothetical protein